MGHERRRAGLPAGSRLRLGLTTRRRGDARRDPEDGRHHKTIIPRDWAGLHLSLCPSSRPCDIARMVRPDLYDYIGLTLAAFIVALWVAHFVLPAPPPEEPSPGTATFPSTSP